MAYGLKIGLVFRCLAPRLCGDSYGIRYRCYRNTPVLVIGAKGYS